MKHIITAIGLMMAVVVGNLLAEEKDKPAPAPSKQPAAAGGQVDIIGTVLFSASHFHEKDKYYVMLAFDGTPEIKAEFDKIMADYYPDKGLDGDAARKFQDQIMTRLKYFVAGPEDLYKISHEAPPIMKLTGVFSEKDGKKWFTVSKWVPYLDMLSRWQLKKDAVFSYPDKMLAPDKPFVMPDRAPLTLKINDTLSLKCIYVPPGKFIMGMPFYQAPHWQEHPPHMVTLTKGFYMSEHPITEEMFEATTCYNPSAVKDPKCATDSSCADTHKFCDLLSAKIGRKVRIPTGAEWEYAARVGTSNPTIVTRYKDQDSTAPRNSFPPVKARQPNAWGFYDMFSRSWERVSDSMKNVYETNDVVDPEDISPQEKSEDTWGKPHQHRWVGNSYYPLGVPEFGMSVGSSQKNSNSCIRFRIVVDLTKEELAGTVKAEKK